MTKLMSASIIWGFLSLGQKSLSACLTGDKPHSSLRRVPVVQWSTHQRPTSTVCVEPVWDLTEGRGLQVAMAWRP